MPDLLRLIKPKKNLEQRVLSAQSGNKAERNALIDEYRPFVKKILSQQLGRYIEEENDPNYAVGLTAFNEAIDHYQKKRGKFLAFSASVIRNRSIDLLRKEKHYQQETPFSALETQENQEVHRIEQSTADHGMEEKLLVQEELQTLIRRLDTLGITLDDLIREAPKHEDTRRNAIKAARFMFNSTEHGNMAMKTGRMPFQALEKQLKLSKKVISRSKKFILAVLLILDSDLDTMKEYIRSMEGGD